MPGKTPKPKSRGKFIGLIVAVVIALALGVGLALFFTYRAGIWGGTPLPTAEEISGASGGEATADGVVTQLKAKGVKASKAIIFSGKKKGVFLGYEGMKPGDRVQKDAAVIVQESGGPGVPKNTMGKQATKVVSTFKTMGVPVHYKQVPVSDTKKKPIGSVVATYPAEGQALSDGDKDDGIYIGVATKSDGGAISIDIVGRDVDTAKSELESQGHDVTLVPRLASKKFVGKVSGSDPMPGSTVAEGDAVTLYYGIDASGVKDAYTVHDSRRPAATICSVSPVWPRERGATTPVTASRSRMAAMAAKATRTSPIRKVATVPNTASTSR